LMGNYSTDFISSLGAESPNDMVLMRRNK
jgi:hypothetical protein